MATTPELNKLTLFELMSGKLLDIELNHPVKVRIKLPLVGYALGQYIIVKYPSAQQAGNYSDVLIEGNSDVLIEGNVAIARYLLEGDRGECFAFRATIKHIIKYPEKLLVLSYPKKIESRQLRLHQRITTNLPSALMLINESEGHDDVQLNGIINDISMKGCGFIFKADNHKVTVNKRDIFVCIFMNDGDDIKIPAKVCNSRNEQGKVSVGIMFNDENDQAIKALLERFFINLDSLS